MIPIRDVIPSRTQPRVVLALAASFAVVFAYSSLMSEAGRVHLLSTCGAVPAVPSIMSWITAPFFHYSLIALGSNLAGLWIFGSTLEDRLGHARLLVFAAAASLGGFAIATWLLPFSFTPLVGAGGLVGGVIGGYLTLFPRSRVLVLVPTLPLDAVEVPATVLVALWFLLQALGAAGQYAFITDQTGPTIWPQIGGLAAGLVLIWPVRRRERERFEWWGV
jgi:membrane associated rhomboid family serine protease